MREAGRIRAICGFEPDSHYKLYLGYTGEAPIGYEEEIYAKWEQISRQLPAITLHMASDKMRRRFICLAALPDTGDAPYLLGQAVERRIVRPYRQRSERAVWAEVPADCLEDIQKAARDAESLLKEAMPVTDAAACGMLPGNPGKCSYVIWKTGLTKSRKSARHI